jgi:hypothetical protein
MIKRFFITMLLFLLLIGTSTAGEIVVQTCIADTGIGVARMIEENGKLVDYELIPHLRTGPEDGRRIWDLNPGIYCITVYNFEFHRIVWSGFFKIEEKDKGKYVGRAIYGCPDTLEKGET